MDFINVQRTFRTWCNLRCHTVNASAHRGQGLGEIGSGQRQYGIFYAEMSYSTLALWI